MNLSNEHDETINNCKKSYEEICNIHKEYKSNLKEYSHDELLIINFQSNTSVEDLKRDFDRFEKWFSKFFKECVIRLDKLYDMLKEYSDVNNIHNYKDAVSDCLVMLLILINDQERFVNDVSIDSNLFNVKEYIKCLDDLSKNIMGLISKTEED